MDADKAAWIKETGIEKLDPPHVFEYTKEAQHYRLDITEDDCMYYTQNYLDETPLNTIKARLKAHLKSLKKNLRRRQYWAKTKISALSKKCSFS